MSGILIPAFARRRPSGDIRRLTRSICDIPSAIVGGQATMLSGLSKTGTVGQTLTPDGAILGGLASTHAAGATNVLRATIPNSTLGQEGTYGSMLLVFRTTQSSASVFFGGFGSEQGGSGNSIFAVGSSASDGSKLGFWVGGGSNYVKTDTSATINDGKVHAVVISAGPHSASTNIGGLCVLDGVELYNTGSFGVHSGVSTTYSSICAGGYRRGGTDAGSAQVDVLAVIPFARYIRSAEAIRITRDPWALLAPIQRRRRRAVVAAATFNAAWNSAANSVIQGGALNA